MPVPFSFELYPPRSDEIARRMPEIVERLAAIGPDFISVTFGAGGSTRDRSLAVVRDIHGRTNVRVLAHLTCVGSSYAEARSLIRAFLDAGVEDFLALRGDPPAGCGEADDFLGDLRTAAELVQLIRHVSDERARPRLHRIASGQWVAQSPRRGRIAVAAYPNGHPQSRSLEQDYDTLLAKEAAGATLAITQLFFEVDDYFRFVEGARRRGVRMPIVPGIMPITSERRLERIASLAHEPVPHTLRCLLAAEPDRDAKAAVGVEHAAAMARRLVDGGAPGIHLYTQNHVDQSIAVLRRIGAVADAPVERPVGPARPTATQAV